MGLPFEGLLQQVRRNRLLKVATKVIGQMRFPAIHECNVNGHREGGRASGVEISMCTAAPDILLTGIPVTFEFF